MDHVRYIYIITSLANFSKGEENCKILDGIYGEEQPLPIEYFPTYKEKTL